MAVIRGTSGADALAGTVQGDLIFGFGGKDTVLARAGDDTVHGGFGNDDLRGEAGNDLLFGQAGNDTITGGDGADRMFGDADNDFLFAGGGNDVLDGGDGSDNLFGRAGADTLYGRAGDDFLYGGAESGSVDTAPDRLFGGDGNDILLGTDNARDFLWGEAGNDAFTVTNDVVRAGAGNDDVGLQDQNGFGTGNIDVTLGVGADRVFANLLNDRTGATLVRDFTAEDQVTGELFNAANGKGLGSTDLFAALDRNNDRTIDASDDGSRMVNSFSIGVDVSAGNTTLHLDDASLTLADTTAISADQWYFFS